VAESVGRKVGEKWESVFYIGWDSLMMRVRVDLKTTEEMARDCLSKLWRSNGLRSGIVASKAEDVRA